MHGWKRHGVTLMVAALYVATSPPGIGAKQSHRGIVPLTNATLAEAVALGEARGAEGATIYSAPITFAIDPTTFDKRGDARFKLLTEGPYSLLIQSPYVRAILMAADAKRRNERRPILSAAALNAGKVVVRVSAGRNFANAGTIENVVVKRGSEIVRPLKAALKPTTVQNRLGGTSAPSAEGLFTFDFSVFEPTSSVTFVLIGNSENIELSLTGAELARLR